MASQASTPPSAVTPTYGSPAIEMERGEGVYLYDTSGKKYLDFAGGIAVNALGHAHPAMIEALTQQAGQLWHTSNLYRIPGQERLARRLTELSFAERVQFCNSGAEAMEGCIKYARRYHFANGQPERWRAITFSASFHGRTLATISAAKGKKLVEGFGPEVDGFDQVSFGNMNEVRAAITPETAMIIAEPIQGEGGIVPAQLGFLAELRAVCDEFGLLLVLDEIQSGYGRTGKLFAHEWAGISPDLRASAKGLGGGFPMGAILSTEEAAKGMVPGTHGTTYGGNPLAMAVGNAVLDVITAPGFLDQVDRNSRAFWEQLKAFEAANSQHIETVRGAGLMLGVKLKQPYAAGEFVNALRELGMTTAPAGDNVVRLLPPLIAQAEHFDEAIQKMTAALAQL